MVVAEVVMKKKAGLQSKTAAVFIQKASNYKSSIWVEKNDRKANAKSLLGLLSLSIGYDSKIVISAEGEDEQLAVEDLKNYLGSNGENDSGSL